MSNSHQRRSSYLSGCNELFLYNRAFIHHRSIHCSNFSSKLSTESYKMSRDYMHYWNICNAILLTLLPKMGVHRDSLLKFDTIFHSIILTYLIIIFYVLLFITFKKKAAASRSLQEDQRTEGRGRRTCLERKFIVVNFFLVAILFLCSQPVTILGMVSLYSSEDPNSPEFLIASLIVENVLYLKFLLDPFLYAWRIPKYRQALKIILRWNHSKNKKPCRGSMFSDCAIAELSLSRDTVITHDFKAISQ